MQWWTCPTLVLLHPNHGEAGALLQEKNRVRRVERRTGLPSASSELSYNQGKGVILITPKNLKQFCFCIIFFNHPAVQWWTCPTLIILYGSLYLPLPLTRTRIGHQETSENSEIKKFLKTDIYNAIPYAWKCYNSVHCTALLTLAMFSSWRSTPAPPW